MITKALLLLGLAGMFFAGCKSVDRTRADYHNDRAKAEAKDGNFGKAIDEKKKANRAADDAKHDPLP